MAVSEASQLITLAMVHMAEGRYEAALNYFEVVLHKARRPEKETDILRCCKECYRELRQYPMLRRLCDAGDRLGVAMLLNMDCHVEGAQNNDLRVLRSTLGQDFHVAGLNGNPSADAICKMVTSWSSVEDTRLRDSDCFVFFIRGHAVRHPEKGLCFETGRMGRRQGGTGFAPGSPELMPIQSSLLDPFIKCKALQGKPKVFILHILSLRTYCECAHCKAGHPGNPEPVLSLPNLPNVKPRLDGGDAALLPRFLPGCPASYIEEHELSLAGSSVDSLLVTFESRVLGATVNSTEGELLSPFTWALVATLRDRLDTPVDLLLSRELDLKMKCLFGARPTALLGQLRVQKNMDQKLYWPVGGHYLVADQLSCTLPPLRDCGGKGQLSRVMTVPVRSSRPHHHLDPTSPMVQEQLRRELQRLAEDGHSHVDASVQVGGGGSARGASNFIRLRRSSGKIPHRVLRKASSFTVGVDGGDPLMVDLPGLSPCRVSAGSGRSGGRARERKTSLELGVGARGTDAASQPDNVRKMVSRARDAELGSQKMVEGARDTEGGGQRVGDLEREVERRRSLEFLELMGDTVGVGHQRLVEQSRDVQGGGEGMVGSVRGSGGSGSQRFMDSAREAEGSSQSMVLAAGDGEGVGQRMVESVRYGEGRSQRMMEPVKDAEGGALGAMESGGDGERGGDTLQSAVTPKGHAFEWVKGDLIGSGAYGEVYKAFNRETGEIMAVKQLVLSDIGPKDPRYSRYLKEVGKEISMYRNLKHEHIVEYINMQLDAANKKLYIFLQYASGGSISRMLKSFGPFSEGVTRQYTRQLLLGLQYLHHRNIVHGDIKGGNVLVHGKCVKLADFGTAQALEESCNSSRLCKPICGSICWMAPEVLQCSGYERPADIWSVGCTVVEMLSGTHPWPDVENELAAIYRIGKAQSGPPIPATASAVARDFISRCFTMDPSCRPSVDEMLAHPFVKDVNSEMLPECCKKNRHGEA